MSDDRHAEIVNESIAEGVPRLVFDLLDALTDAQRRATFAAYCSSCGGMEPGCQCWNDE